MVAAGAGLVAPARPAQRGFAVEGVGALEQHLGAVAARVARARAGAGGAAHLPGMIAAKTTLPVIGVPVQSRALSGMDSLLSIVQMPGGVPVATVAIGKAGAINAGLLAVQILSIENQDLADQLEKRREDLKQKVLESSEDLV